MCVRWLLLLSCCFQRAGGVAQEQRPPKEHDLHVSEKHILHGWYDDVCASVALLQIKSLLPLADWLLALEYDEERSRVSFVVLCCLDDDEWMRRCTQKTAHAQKIFYFAEENYLVTLSISSKDTTSLSIGVKFYEFPTFYSENTHYLLTARLNQEDWGV